MIARSVSGLAFELLNIIFPRRCALCGCSIPSEDAFEVCPACKTQLPLHAKSSCVVCGKAMDGSLVGAGIVRCGDCRLKPPPVDATVAALRYEGTGRQLIHRFKFGGMRKIAGTLAPIICSRIHVRPDMGNADLIVPIPLHRGRLFARGYNQAYLLAMEIGCILSIPVSAGLIERRLDTPSQSSLTRQKRFANMKKAFCVTDTAVLKGTAILLVDDVMTTGATIFEAAKTLKKAGARRVTCAVAARA